MKMSTLTPNTVQAFELEGFRDYLAFERGLSVRTIESYMRDVGPSCVRLFRLG